MGLGYDWGETAGVFCRSFYGYGYVNGYWCNSHNYFGFRASGYAP